MNSRPYSLPSAAGAIVIAVTAGLLASCGDSGDQPAAALPRQVKVIELHNGGAPKPVEFPGQITAVQQTWKAFEVTGRITELPVKEGQLIRKEDLLAKLDPRDYRSTRDSAQAQHDAAVAAEARLRPLFEKRAVSEQQLELAERDLRTAKANLERAQKALDDTELHADFDGTVAKVLVDDFANVDAKEDVMLIQDISSMEIIIHVPESIFAIPMEGETDAERVAQAKPVVIPSTMGEALDKRLAQLAPEIPLGIEIGVVSHQSASVTQAIDGFVSSLVQALVIVVGVLLIFMGLRSGLLMTMIGLPVFYTIVYRIRPTPQ